jgi:aminodeoxyfutalosine synthase
MTPSILAFMPRKPRENVPRERPAKRPTANVDLSEVTEKVRAGERLSLEDGVKLFESSNLLAVGQLANEVRERLHGDVTYWNTNRHVNPTNVCFVGCELCAYQDIPNAPGTWSYSPEETVEMARRDYSPDVREFHIVGGLHPQWKFEVYLDVLRALKAEFPHVHLKAYTMVEIDWLARLAKKSVEETIDLLREAGLDSCPGGGAEIFHPRARDIVAQRKITGDRWLEVARMCHEKGLRTNATILYGHVETFEERVDHLIQLRGLQDETGGFDCFIPLAFHPANTPFEGHMPGATDGFDDLKTIAVSRLMLDNFAHIKAYWVMLTQKVAQLALHFGANDLDGTVIDERITHAAGGVSGKGMTRAELEEFIREAGRVPVERDTLYRPVDRPEAPAAAGHGGGA